MNQHFKRMTALCLLVALVFGLVGEVPFMALATAETDSSANTDVGENTVENLMAGLNPSFEDYTIPNWSKMEGVVQSDEQLCDDGKWALQLNDSSSTASTWSVSDKVTIEAGKNYTISAQVYGGIGQMTAYLYDADANELADQTISIAAAQAADSWQTLSQDFTAPSNATQIAVKLSTTDTGEAPVWFDAVSVVSADTTLTGGNVLTNGGFDTRSIVSNTPWDKWEAGGLSVANKLAVDYIGGDYGYAARIYGSSNVQTWSAPVAVTPGETYSVSLDAKGEGCIQVYIRYYASAEATYSEYMSNAMLKTVTLNEKDSWTQVAVSGSVAPEGAACARVWVVAVAGGKEFSFNFDNVRFVNGLAELKVPGEIGALRNPSFEELNENMSTAWTKWGGNETVHSIVTRDADTAEASTNVYAGDYALKISVPTEMSGSHGVISSAFPVESGVTYRLSGYVMEDYDEGSGFQMYIKYYDKYGRENAAFYVNTPASGEWNYCDVIGTAPEDALFAKVLLVSGGGKGNVLFDNLSFEYTGNAAYAPVKEDLTWSLMYSGYPRLDFDEDGLDRIIGFSRKTDLCAYGYSGTSALNDLRTLADKYVNETTHTITYKQEVTVEYKLNPVLVDPNVDPDICELFKTPPTGYTVFPYLTAYGQAMVKRVQTLSLAYAITGEDKYGVRAKQYAMDLCDWDYWVFQHQTFRQEGNKEQSSQVTGYILDCVMTVYDLCYDLFTTEEEHNKIKNAIIEKALDPMLNDCWARMNRDRDMDHATGMILGACLIMNENNIQDMKKYLDMGMTYINWRLNYNQNSGVNEGHSYDSLAIDDIVKTLYTLQRVTGYEGPFEHPYMDELEKRVLGFFEMVNGELPAYSDSDYASTYYPYSMAVFSQQGNELATYYLAVGGALSSAYDKLIWHTDKTFASLTIPDDRAGNVTYVGAHGEGALRTGWGTLDSLLVINANNTQKEHNHYDQNSIQLAFNGKWMLSDTEYKDNSYSDLTTWQMKYTNSTIFVDGKPQIRKGQGSLESVFNTHVYGYMIGNAPGAYGMEDKQPVLNKFDRHVIMLNHDSQPYYVIIDDLASNKERNFGWNFYTNGWDQLEINGAIVNAGESATGNRVTISHYGCTLHSYFVGGAVTTREVTYKDYGPTLLLESEADDNYQFMNVLSVQNDTANQTSIKFAELADAGKAELSGNGNPTYSVDASTGLLMFTAYKIGDDLIFTFNVSEEQAGDNYITVDVSQTLENTALWNVYLDGAVYIKAKSLQGPEGTITLDLGKVNLTAGDHTVQFTLPQNWTNGVTLACDGINLRKAGESVGEGNVKVLESYNKDALLGAKISYGTVLSDIVLFNRGTGTIDTSVLSTTHVSTNGQQASILGLNGGDISEGYAVTNGTSLRYGNLALMTSDSPVSVAVDFTMAKLPVLNGVDEPEVHEDFNENNPVIYVSSKAEAATEASIYLGINATYTVIINGQTVESQYIADTGMLTMTIPAGVNQITIASVHDHEWVDANCTTPRTCSLCGETEGEALGHTWVEATCTTPRTCSTCGTTVGTVKAPSTTVINFADVNGIDELLANGWSYYLDNSSTVFSIVEDAERGNVLQFSHDGSLTYVKDENGAVVKNEDGTDKVANPFGIISGFVPVNGGADVRITMDVKRLDANAPASYMLYVYFYGSDYNAVANEAGSSSVANRFYYHGTSWDAGMVNDVVQFDLTLPESAAYVKYMIYDTSSVTGTIQFDNIVIQEVETITTVDDVLRTDDLYEKTTIAYSNLNKVGSFENITTTGLRALGWNPRNRDNDTGWLAYTSVVYDQTRGSNVLKRESSNIQIFLHPLVDVSGMSEFWYEMNVSISDGAHLSIYPAFFDADGNALSKGSTITVSSSVTRDGTWQNYIGTAKEVPEGAAYIMAFIQTGYGTVMIDNFNCVAVAAEETDVDVTFEEGWNWDNLLKRGWSTSSSEIGVPTIEKVNGNCVLKAVNTNLTGSRFIYSPYIALGDTETMYFSAEGMKSSGYVYAYVRFYDANKNAIKYTNAAGKTVNLQFSVNAYSNGQWVTLDTVCNFAEVAETYADSITGTPAYARIMLQMEKPGTDGATTEYYWDNISLRADNTTHNVSENSVPMISTGDK